jgi:hypothetical protein
MRKILYISGCLIMVGLTLSCDKTKKDNGEGNGGGKEQEEEEKPVVSDDPTILFVHNGEDLASILENLPDEVREVRIGEGTFTGNFKMKEGVSVSGSWNRTFTETIQYDPLVSTDGITTILDGGGKGAVLTQVSAFETETVWKNISLRNGWVTTADTHGCVWLKAGGTLDGCEVSYNINVESGNCGGGVYSDMGSRVLRCWIHDNGGSRGGGIFTKGELAYSLIEKNIVEGTGRGGGISVFGANDREHRARIYNCIIRNNVGGEGGGIHVERYATVYNCLVTGNKANVNVSGIQTNGSYGCNIINCTVVGNEDVSSSAYASGICCSEHGVLINNLVYGNTSSGKQSVEATQIIVNNKYLFFFNNAFPEGLMFQKETPWKQERHDDASNVTIAESEMQDGFMPAQGSPLIDKGLEEVAVNGHEDGVVPSWTEIDIAGGQRHVRTIDIGCYEYQN